MIKETISVDSLCTHDISNFFFIFPIFLGYVVHLGAFFEFSHISKIFSNIFVGKDLHISGPMHSKSVLFKGQLVHIIAPNRKHLTSQEQTGSVYCGTVPRSHYAAVKINTRLGGGGWRISQLRAKGQRQALKEYILYDSIYTKDKSRQN